MSTETKTKETKKVVLSELKALVEGGAKKEDLAKEYGLPMTQVTKLLQTAGLKIRKFHKVPAFELVDDTEKSSNLAEENTSTSDLETKEDAETTTKEDAPVLAEANTEIPAEDAPKEVVEEDETPKTFGETFNCGK